MTHLGVLRISLLLAIGVVPVACGGTMSKSNEGGDGAASGSGGGRNANAGTSSGGMTTRGGTGSGGTVGKMVPPTAGTASGGTTPTTPTCSGSKLDPTTGLVHCQEGYYHRAKEVECGGYGGAPASAGASNDDPKPRATGAEPCGDVSFGGLPPSVSCKEFELGYCSLDEGGSYPGAAACRSGCIVDEDCGKGHVCECGNPESPTGGVCVPTDNCHTDAECLPGFFCTTYAGSCGSTGYACLTPNDQCRSSEDCAPHDDCAFGAEGPFRSCQEGLECGSRR